MTEFNPVLTEALVAHVIDERENQHEKWGAQSWPSFYSEANVREYGRKAESWKQINDAREKEGALTWDGILLEEVFEALSETEPHLRMNELIQVAAVALAEAEHLAIFLSAIENEEEPDDVYAALVDGELELEFEEVDA